MKLIIVRHAETIGNKMNTVQGVNDSPLTGLGKEQARRLSERLLKENIDVIYSSDSARCKRTIEPLLKTKKIPVKYTKNLREFNRGFFDGKPTSDYWKWVQENGGFNFDLTSPDGESFNDVLKRTRIFLDKILESEKGKTILLVTSAAAKRALIMNLLDKKNMDYYYELREISRNTAFTVIDLFSGRPKITTLCSTEHLEGLDEN